MLLDDDASVVVVLLDAAVVVVVAAVVDVVAGAEVVAVVRGVVGDVVDAGAEVEVDDDEVEVDEVEVDVVDGLSPSSVSRITNRISAAATAMISTNTPTRSGELHPDFPVPSS